MGSGIALHFAGAGFEVLLLDLKSDSNNPNQIVDSALQKSLANKPSNSFHSSVVKKILTGNFTDDLSKIKNCDWIIEVVVERLDIKQSLYTQVEQFRKPGTIITSNTSGIPINMLAQGRTEDFKKNFCGTHFFNPPRYLRLLEIIPIAETDPALVDFLMDFGQKFLGKQTVLCKDTPAFIANRIGVVSMAKVFELTAKLGLSIGDADKLTGPALGRPKSGTFRLTDVVGLDTAAFVIQGLKQNCPNDHLLQSMKMPEVVQYLVDQKWFGNKSGKGFYVKTEEKDSKGKNVIHSINLSTKDYGPDAKQNLESLGVSKQIEDLPRRIQAILKCKDAGAELIRQTLGFLFAYSSFRIPEISDSLYSIDAALKNGFAWELGPFEYWDSIGIEQGIELAKMAGEDCASWVSEMQSAGASSFYKKENGRLHYYDVSTKQYLIVPGQDQQIHLQYLNNTKPVYQNDELVLHDIGDGVLCAEFKSKYNAIGEGILRGLQESVKIAEEQGWNGLVIGNHATNFSVGANLMMIGMLAFQQEYDQLDMAVRLFQQTSMRLRTSSIPVVAATQGYVFGGGVELSMHCDEVVASAESYIGLVEVGIGVIPGGGGTKEFAVRLSDQIKNGEVIIPQLIDKFKVIATASVATSAFEAFDYGYLLKERDRVSLNSATTIYQAKKRVLALQENYVPKSARQDIHVLGKNGLGALYAGAHSLFRAKYASEHDIKIAKKVAHVLCGGELSMPQQVSEQYLLDIEREAFLSLCTEPKTLERIQYMLENNKPLRN